VERKTVRRRLHRPPRRHQCIMMRQRKSAVGHGVRRDAAGQWAVMLVGWVAV
jgi:hypothetical protein